MRLSYCYTPHAVSKAVKKVSFGFCRTTNLEWDKKDETVQFILILAIPDSKKEEDNFERRFSHFFDFPANNQVYDVKDEALKEIFERITQNIFNETLAKW
mgnify:CR=1 FL=1